MVRWHCRILLNLLLFSSSALLSAGQSLGDETFDEDLLLRPLQDGKLLARFAFTTRLKDAMPRDPRTLLSEDESQHYTLFPLSFGQLLREYAITELHLNLNAGRWNYENWGYPEELGVGTGAELWAWMADSGPMSVDERWSGLRNGLAGLICASLGSMDEIRTTKPALSFQPEGSLPDWNITHQIRHATLPSEHVCTENLTPFVKLLPCKSLSGIAMLLNPHKLLDADWHGMALHVLWDPEDGVTVKLSFQLVVDPLRTLEQRTESTWSLSGIFGRSIERSCPVATSSRVSCTLPTVGTYSVSPEPVVTDGLAIYDTSSLIEPLDVSFRWQADFENGPLELTYIPSTNLVIQRTLRGSNQAYGRIIVTIQNLQSDSVRLLYLETMPWLVQFYLHTLKIHVDDVLRNDLISNMSYILPVAHSRPATFQSILTIPGQSSLILSIDVTKAFLRYTEHPPDAQRGWDLPPAVFTPLFPADLDAGATDSSPSGGGRERFGRRIYTSTLLVDLATPDFSMPYNVIVLSCTLMAFIFGTVFNLMARKFVVVDLNPRNGGKAKEKEKEEPAIEDR